MIIEIVDTVFTILFDNKSSSGLFVDRDPGELLVVVVSAIDVDAAADVVVADNGAADAVLLADAADVVVIDNDAAVVVAVDTGSAVVDVTASVVVVTDGAAVVVVGFNAQIRSDERLPLNEMDSLLLHCFQFVQLVPIN
jgi:hypothetical protein